MKSVQTRFGGLFGRDLVLSNGIAVKPYAKATWVTEQTGDSQVKVSGVKPDSQLPGSRLEIGGGVSVLPTQRNSYFAEGIATAGKNR
jgi:outer membrane autotransporter protein